MSTFSKLYFFLSMTTPRTGFWALLLTAYGNGKVPMVFIRSPYFAQRQALDSISEAILDTLSAHCRGRLATLYFAPSPLRIWLVQPTDGQRALTSPQIWRLMLSLKNSRMLGRHPGLKRRGIFHPRQVRPFTLDRAKANAFVGCIAIPHLIPGTSTYVLKLSARATSLGMSARR